MTTRTPSMAWDDPAWVEADKPLAARLRARQGRHRELVLRRPAGPHKPSGTAKLVVSMLPTSVLTLPTSQGSNFLNDEVLAAVEARLAKRTTAEEYWPGSVETDRLRRNMLSSQPAAFNLFGNLVDDPSPLLGWVRGLDAEATAVHEVRIEWAPRPTEHLGSRSAFDVVVFYAAGADRGFVGVECKYAENLKANFKPETAGKYEEAITALGSWRPGAFAELNRPGLNQFLLNVSLAESLRQRGSFERGRSVVVACGEDAEARHTTEVVASRIEPGAVPLRWSSFEDLLAAIPDRPVWVNDFRRRYLEDPS